jgi:hypothetical protein
LSQSLYLDETFTLPACPNGAGLVAGAAIDLAVDAGPVDEMPEDPTDDRYGTSKELLWSRHDYNLGDGSYGFVDANGTPCAVTGWEQDPVTGQWTNLGAPEVCPAMYSNARSHRGFICGDLLVTAYSLSPNWAAGRNGNDRYNICVRRSFDGGHTWTTDPAGAGVDVCPEYRSDPNNPDPDGLGNLPSEVFDATCGTYDTATYLLDGCDPALPILCFVEDEYVDNMFFVAWGTVDNAKSTGSTGVKAEGSPLDLFYTRTENYGDTYLKIPWLIGGLNSNQGYGETVWRYDYIAKGEPEEQGECQPRAISDDSKVYAIYHSSIGAEEDPEKEYKRWYPGKPEESYENALWFQRVIFRLDELTAQPIGLPDRLVDSTRPAYPSLGRDRSVRPLRSRTRPGFCLSGGRAVMTR